MTAPLTQPDLDAIKAQGLNSAAHSLHLLAEHEHRQRLDLHAEMVARWLRDNPSAGPADVDLYSRTVAVEVGL